MELRGKLSEVSRDRRFLGIFLTGVLLSFILSVNNKSFPGFLGFFLLGSLVSLLVAVSWTGIERNYLRVIAVLAILLASGSGLLFFIKGQTSCVAWSAHSAENPVTGTCQAYVYGGCGPTPEPWYYGQCSPESRNEMCGRLKDSEEEEDERLRHHLCTDTPELSFSVISYDEKNETMALEVEKSTVNSLNTRFLKIGGEEKNFTIRANGELYNNSILISRVRESIFGNSLENGTEFTILRDGDDADEDGINGVDPYGDSGIFYNLQWYDEDGSDTGNMALEYSKSEGVETSWIL